MIKKIRKSSLDRKMDRLLRLEESGKLKTDMRSRTLKKMISNRLAVLGIVIFVVILILCFFAPIFTKYNPNEINLRAILQEPSKENIFGTDQLGRDIWSRMLYGGRISIIIGFGSALGAALVGVTLGIIGGYRGGWIDLIILKISDIFLSFPQIILILIVVAITGASLSNLIIIFILTGWPSMYRMARSQVLSIKEEEFVQALKAFGISSFKICFKHILPNALGPVFVNITLSTAMFILQEASLSYLGLGIPQEIATWGNIINVVNGRFDYITDNWWLWVPAGVMLTLFVLSINFIGDGLRDASDPTQIG